MSWDWHTALLIMGGIACIEVYRLFKIVNQQADEIEDLRKQIRGAYGELADRLDDIENKISKSSALPSAPNHETLSQWELYQKRRTHYLRHKLLDCLGKIRAAKNA